MKTIITFSFLASFSALGFIPAFKAHLDKLLKTEREKIISAALVYSQGTVYCAHVVYALLKNGEIVLQYKDTAPVRIPARGAKIVFVEYCE